MNSMLRNALRKNLGLRQQLEKNLLCEEGDVWEAELKKFLRRETCWAAKAKATKSRTSQVQLFPPPPPKLLVDRSKPFDPTTFIAQDWTIWKGPSDGTGIEGEKWQDGCSLDITEIDPRAIGKNNFKTGLEGEETVITGYVKHARLSGKTIQADAKIAQALYEEEGQKTLRFLYDTLGVTWMEFLGTILRSPDGHCSALYLCRRGDGKWVWHCLFLDDARSASDPALGFASPQN